MLFASTKNKWFVAHGFRNFLNAPYHHQGSWWDHFLDYQIYLLMTNILMYHNGIWLKIWFVALLSLQIPSMLCIIIKGLDEATFRFIWFVFQKRKFWCIKKLSSSKVGLLLFWAYKSPQCSVWSSRVLMTLVIDSSDASLKDKKF